MPDFVTVAYGQTGASTKVDALGMRAMQARAYHQRGEQYLLVKAPPASGKSRALMFLGLDKLRNQGLSKVIVAVPQRSIGSSFKSADLSKNGFFEDWKLDPRLDLTDGGTSGKVDRFVQFMSSPTDEILLCTHSTLRFAYDQLGAAAFANTVVAIDEFHHASADEDNRLGEVVRGLFEDGRSHIIAMTGSYFRGDMAPVLTPEDEARFTVISYTYFEQLEGYSFLKTLGIGYHFYRGSYITAINEVLDPHLKTIVHIPHVASSESTREGKLTEVDAILDHLGTVTGKDPATGFYLVDTGAGGTLKVADLVDDGPQRELVVRSLREIKRPDDLDIIIALGMAKEGFDWIWCEHALTVGYRGSLTEIIQIIGRATRDAPGKKHAQFTNLISEPDAAQERVADAVNSMLKAVACSLLMEAVLAPNWKFTARDDGDDIDGTPQVTKIDPTGEDSVIAIKGFATPSTPRTKQIIESDLNDLSAAIFQDEAVLRAAMNPDEFAPEVLNQVFLPRVISKRYPDLSPEEVEEVRQHVVANAVMKSPSVTVAPEGDVRFLRMAERLVNIDELSIDLIESINPFQRAYEVLSKSVTADVLRGIHEVIRAGKVEMTKEEAEALWPRIVAFRRDNGFEPRLVSELPMERRMAEALAWIRDYKRKQTAQ